MIILQHCFPIKLYARMETDLQKSSDLISAYLRAVRIKKKIYKKNKMDVKYAKYRKSDATIVVYVATV